jgi:hypothetical protein
MKGSGKIDFCCEQEKFGLKGVFGSVWNAVCVELLGIVGDC